MTGNDIVDLSAAAVESNWRRPGYLEKLFSPEEIDLILSNKDPDKTLWRIWTMKESAYKLHIRMFGGRSFAPQKITCTLTDEQQGEVQFRDNRYLTQTSQNQHYIHTVAFNRADRSPSFSSCCFELPLVNTGTQNSFIMEKLTSHYSRASGTHPSNLSLRKDIAGIPFLYCYFERKSIPVSITHHGRYAAFTIH